MNQHKSDQQEDSRKAKALEDAATGPENVPAGSLPLPGKALNTLIS